MMPVDLGIPNLIIQAFQAGREEKMRREELALKREREIEEIRQFNESLKERQKQFDIEEKRRKEEFEATNKIALGTAALQKLKGLSDITKVLEAGRSIPGVERVATSKLGESQINTFRIPQELGGDLVAARDPLTAARQTAKLQETLLQPKTEARIKELKAKSVADFTQNAVFEDIKFQHQLTRDKINNDIKLAVANIRKTTKKQTPLGQLDLEPIAQGILEGQYTLSDLNKISMSKEDRIKLMNELNKLGIRPLTDQQRSTFAEFQSALETLPLYDAYLAAAPETTGLAGALMRAPGIIVSSETRNLLGQMEGRAINLARVLGGERGMTSERDRQAAINAFFPRPTLPTAQNLQRRLSLEQTIINRFNAKFSALSQKQRNVLADKLGLQLKSAIVAKPGDKVWNPQTKAFEEVK